MICPKCNGNGYWVEQLQVAELSGLHRDTLRMLRQIRQCERCSSQGEINETNVMPRHNTQTSKQEK